MSASLDDARLIESVQAAQDPQVFAELVRTHQRTLFGHALRRLHDRAAAEDAVQETFVRAYRALPRLTGEYKLGPWLHRIMANVCIDEANRRRRECEKVDRFSSQADAVALVPDVEQQLGFEVDDRGLREAFETLSPSYREALALRFVDELPYDEVARVAGVSEQNARARVSRARTAMRSALRGVAVMPVLLVGVIRRGERAAAALQLETGRAGSAVASASAAAPAAVNPAGAATTATTATTAAVQVGPLAAAAAPLVDVANAAAVSAPQAVPLVTKAVIGLGMAAAVAVPTAGPAIMDRAPAPAAVSQPAPTTVLATGPAPTTATTVGGASTTVPSTSTVPTASSTPSTVVTDTTIPTTMARAAAPSTTVRGTSTVVTSTVPVTSQPASASASTTTVVPATTVVPPPASVPTTVAERPVETTVPPRTGGAVSGRGLRVSPAGPRVDLAGTVMLTMNGASHQAKLSGRLGFAEPDASGRQRVDGTLSLGLADGGTVEVRLAGQASAPLPTVPGWTPDAVSVIGPFRAAGNTLALVESGTVSGTVNLAAGTLSLTLAG